MLRRTVPVNQLGISFPPYPFTLYGLPQQPAAVPVKPGSTAGFKPYGALNPKFRYPERVTNDMVVIESPDKIESRSKRFFSNVKIV